MAKVIKVDTGNGTSAFVKEDLKGSQDGISLCSQCPKRKTDTRFGNCHISNKVHELEMLFGLKLPVLQCPSFAGEVEAPEAPKVKEPKQEEPDSAEDE